jgi:hypothetical protein
MPKARNKKNTRSAKENDAINDQVDETIDYLIDDVVDDSDTESAYSEESENFQSEEDEADYQPDNESERELKEESYNSDQQRFDENEDCEGHDASHADTHGEGGSYSHYDKEVMVKKISRLQRDEHKIIRRIIKKYSPSKKMRKVTGGSYLYFHNLDDAVYLEIDRYLDDLSRKNKEEFQRYISETENLYNSTEDLRSDDIESATKARYRLSNREKHMVNRQRFDKIRTEEIKESIQMNHKRREKKDKSKSDRNIDLISSDKRVSRTINIGTSDINTVFDTLSQTERDSGRHVPKAKKGKRAVESKSKRGKNIFSKNK